MIFKTKIQTILTKKMDRKDFIKHMALGAVAFTGFSSVLKVLDDKSESSAGNSGYGASAYGGYDETKIG